MRRGFSSFQMQRIGMCRDDRLRTVPMADFEPEGSLDRSGGIELPRLAESKYSDTVILVQVGAHEATSPPMIGRWPDPALRHRGRNGDDPDAERVCCRP